MRVWTVLVVSMLAFCAGCKRSETETMMRDPNYPLYEKVRAGSFQLSVASNSVVAALDAYSDAKKAAPKSGEVSEAMLDIEDYLESAGDLIAKYIDEPVAFETFKVNLKARKTRLGKAVQDANDAYQDLTEADGVLQSLKVSSPALSEKLQTLEDAIADAQDDVASAIEAMGGPPPDIASS